MHAAFRAATGLARAASRSEYWEVSEPAAPAVSPHPHRRPLRATKRARRPGAVAARPQVCTTPLWPIDPPHITNR